jgi:hypothetical protein
MGVPKIGDRLLGCCETEGSQFHLVRDGSEGHRDFKDTRRTWVERYSRLAMDKWQFFTSMSHCAIIAVSDNVPHIWVQIAP